MNREELIEYTNNFYEQYLYICDIYYISLDSKKVEQHGNIAKSYFTMVSSACIDSYFMTLARLYDESGDSETMFRLIKTCKKNKELFINPDNMLAFLTDQGRVLKKDETLKTAINVIKHKRNKYIAHNDTAYFYHYRKSDLAVIDDMKISINQVWELIGRTGCILEKILDELEYNKQKMSRKYNRELYMLFPELEKYCIYPI